MNFYPDIAKSLNAKRVANAARIASSFYKSRLSGKVKIKGMPVSMSVEPTTACNLGCTQCPSGLKQFTRPTGNLKPQLFDALMEEVQDTLVYLTLYFQGEPFINPHFFHFVESASKRKIYTATSTNAHFITEEVAQQIVHSGLNRLIISMDGLTQETYEQYRVDGDLSKVLESMENLLIAKEKNRSRGPFTELQFIIFKHNEHEVPELKKWAKKMKVNRLLLKTAQIYDYENAEHLIPENHEFSRYKKDDRGRFQIKNKLFNHCWRMWHSCVMTWDGRIVPCCFDKDGSYAMGHLGEDTFSDIWHGETYSTFRNQLFSKRKSIDICTNCSEGTRVWI